MTTFITRTLPAALALLFLALPPVEGSSRLTESFTSPEGGVPAAWKAVDRGPASVVNIQHIPDIGATGLLIARAPNGVGSGALWYTGSDLGEQKGKIANLHATVTIRIDQPKKSTSSARGIVLRAKDTRYEKFQGYYIAFQSEGEKAGLGIYWNPTNHVENGEELAFSAFKKPLQNRTDYILQVSAKGEEIQASLWSVDTSGAKETSLAEVQITGANNTGAGYFGLRGSYGNSGPVNTWFRSLHLGSTEE